MALVQWCCGILLIGSAISLKFSNSELRTAVVSNFVPRLVFCENKCSSGWLTVRGGRLLIVVVLSRVFDLY